MAMWFVIDLGSTMHNRPLWFEVHHHKYLATHTVALRFHQVLTIYVSRRSFRQDFDSSEMLTYSIATTFHSGSVLLIID